MYFPKYQMGERLLIHFSRHFPAYNKFSFPLFWSLFFPLSFYLMSQRQATPLQQMVHSTPNQREAIRELEQLFCLDQNVLKDIVNSFRNELAAGLADDRTSDLNMIPTYVTG